RRLRRLPIAVTASGQRDSEHKQRRQNAVDRRKPAHVLLSDGGKGPGDAEEASLRFRQRDYGAEGRCVSKSGGVRSVGRQVVRAHGSVPIPTWPNDLTPMITSRRRWESRGAGD